MRIAAGVATVFGLALSLVTTGADAKCASRGVWLASRDASIPTNGRVVIDAFMNSRKLFDDVAKRNPRLRSGKDVVALEVVEQREGELYVRQTIFKPKTTLRAN